MFSITINFHRNYPTAYLKFHLWKGLQAFCITRIVYAHTSENIFNKKQCIENEMRQKWKFVAAERDGEEYGGGWRDTESLLKVRHDLLRVAMEAA